MVAKSPPFPSPEPTDLAVEAFDDAGDSGGQCLVEQGGRCRPEGATVETAVARGNSLVGRGCAVSVCLRDALDEPAHSQPAQVV